MIDMEKYSQRCRVEGNFLVTGYKNSEKRIVKNVEPDFNLGYVIGAYLAVGSVNIITYKNSTRGMVFWYVEKTDKDKIDRLTKSLSESFNLSLSIREQSKSSTYQVVCYSKPLATLLREFGEKSGRKQLPDYHLYKNPDYIKGVVKGIEEFNGHRPDTRKVLRKRKLNLSVIELYNTLKMY